MREERRKLEGELAQGDVTPNNRLRAISRSSASQRKVNYAEGQAADAGARTTVDGTARGERTGKSRAGGSEGESPHSSPSSDADTQPVLGEQTVRLEAQLQSMRLAGNEERPPRQIEEAFYAASQRQASQVEHRAFASHWHKRSEAPLAQGQTPLAYREAVKQYFLSRHERDD